MKSPSIQRLAESGKWLTLLKLTSFAKYSKTIGRGKNKP